MATDFRKLCIALFGTDDVARLREIAEKANQRNPRNAGRKKRFSAADIEDMGKTNYEKSSPKIKKSVD